MTRLLSFSLCCLFPFMTRGETPVDFHAFILSSYTHRESLPGVLMTASALRMSLAQLPGCTLKTQILQDSGPEALKSFLESLPNGRDGGLSVVYIAGHQSAGGEFEFTGKQKILWSRLLEGVTVPPHARRITILDACYAEAADLRSEFVSKMGPRVIFSSAAGERTFELELGSRRPVDYGARYPSEMQWLGRMQQQVKPKQITFFGLMWTRSFLQKAPEPLVMEEWNRFFERLRDAAEEFRRDRSEKLSSKIVVVNRP